MSPKNDPTMQVNGFGVHANPKSVPNSFMPEVEDWKLGPDVEILVLVKRLDKNMTSEISKDTELKNKPNAITGTKILKSPFSCPHCKKSFVSRGKLMAHVRLHTGEIQCKRCGKIFTHNYKLRTHESKYIDESKPFMCNLTNCCSRFISQNDLRTHERSHGINDPYKCDVCDKLFNSSNTLRGHKRQHNPNRRIWFCEHCQKVFSEFCYLKVHLRIHTGEKPYICNLCHRGFTQRISMMRHVRRHTNEKIYKCDQCDNAYTTAVSLHRHSTKHAPEEHRKCKICGKQFANANYLQQHAKIHNGTATPKPKNHICQFCEKRFQSYAYLEKHMRRHTRERQQKHQKFVSNEHLSSKDS